MVHYSVNNLSYKIVLGSNYNILLIVSTYKVSYLYFFSIYKTLGEVKIMKYSYNYGCYNKR